MQFFSFEPANYANMCMTGGLEGLRFDSCKNLIGPVVEGTVVPNGARVPGTPYQLDPIRAAFNIGTMIRWLDYNGENTVPCLSISMCSHVLLSFHQTAGCKSVWHSRPSNAYHFISVLRSGDILATICTCIYVASTIPKECLGLRNELNT